MPVLAEAIRNMRRRPLRSTLTAAGVAIGVAALVLLGALSEKFSHLVAGGRDFATGQITVTGEGTGGLMGLARGALLGHEQLQRLAEVPGVRLAAPLVMFPVADSPSTLPLTLAPMVFGIDPEALTMNRHSLAPGANHGRLLPRAPDEITVGSQVARFYQVKTGDTLEIRKKPFKVVGVLDPTLTGPDSFVFMPFPSAQSLLLESDPVLRRLAMVPGAKILPIATAAAVHWNEGEDPEVVAARIREQVRDVTVMSPAEAGHQVGQAMTVTNSVILGSALVALIVASLAVANTMFTAVVERRREIGLRRVIGATRRQVVRQLVVEATFLGLAGSVGGLVAGAAAAEALNNVTERLGASVFLVTPRLLLLGAVIPSLLAALAGLWPAWRAARLPPTDAVRYV
jgi:putative ABC transport system permease protein